MATELHPDDVRAGALLILQGLARIGEIADWEYCGPDQLTIFFDTPDGELIGATMPEREFLRTMRDAGDNLRERI